MEEAGLQPALLPVSDVSAFEGYRHGMAWPDLEKADAVFTFNVLIALGLARAFTERAPAFRTTSRSSVMTTWSLPVTSPPL